MPLASIALSTLCLAANTATNTPLHPTVDDAPHHLAVVLLELPTSDTGASTNTAVDDVPPPGGPSLHLALEREVTPGLFLVGTGAGTVAAIPSPVREEFKGAIRGDVALTVAGGVRGVFASVGPASVGLQGVVGVGGRWAETIVDLSDVTVGRFGDLVLTGSVHGTATGIVDVELLPSVSLRLAADLVRARLDVCPLQGVASSLAVFDTARVGVAVGF